MPDTIFDFLMLSNRNFYRFHDVHVLSKMALVGLDQTYLTNLTIPLISKLFNKDRIYYLVFINLR